MCISIVVYFVFYFIVTDCTFKLNTVILVFFLNQVVWTFFVLLLLTVEFYECHTYLSWEMF